MLSKYYHLNDNAGAGQADKDVFKSVLLECLKKKYKNIYIRQVFPGGTLGIFFELYADGKRKFAKTHYQGACYRENLEKEIEIMRLLYSNVIEIEKAEIDVDGKRSVVMVMDYLFSHSRQVTPHEVRECMEYYQKKLMENKLHVKYLFGQVIEAGKESLEALNGLGFFRKDVYLHCMESLYRIADRKISEEKAVCHGDLSSVNIMYSERGDPVVIDWEDSVVAFKEYDYLYWLTFFSQRKYYASGLLESSGIDKIWGTDIMALVTIIKSNMAFLNGSYKNNKISFQDRICEIYGMLG